MFVIANASEAIFYKIASSDALLAMTGGDISQLIILSVIINSPAKNFAGAVNQNLNLNKIKQLSLPYF